MPETSPDTLDPILPDDITDLAQEVLRAAGEAKVMLATAESCTGGLLAALLTDVSGLSHAFDRGFVTYSSEAKCDMLDCDATMIEDCGAVSRDTAEAMAKGAIARSNASVAVSITGFAGPGGDDDEEGLVHFACHNEDTSITHREEHFGPIGRDGVRLKALRTSLEMMKESLVREP